MLEGIVKKYNIGYNFSPKLIDMANAYVIKLYTATAHRAYKLKLGSSITELDILKISQKYTEKNLMFDIPVVQYIDMSLVHSPKFDLEAIVSKMNYCLEAFDTLSKMKVNKTTVGYSEDVERNGIDNTHFIVDILSNVPNLYIIDLNKKYAEELGNIAFEYKIKLPKLPTTANYSQILRGYGKNTQLIEDIKPLIHKYYETKQDQTFLDYVFSRIAEKYITDKDCYFINYDCIIYKTPLYVISKPMKKVDFSKQFEIGTICKEFEGEGLSFYNNLVGFSGEFIREDRLKEFECIKKGLPVTLRDIKGNEQRYYFIKSLAMRIGSVIKPLFSDIDDVETIDYSDTIYNNTNAKFSYLLNRVIDNHRQSRIGIPNVITEKISYEDYDAFMQFALYELYKAFGHTEFVTNRYK